MAWHKGSCEVCVWCFVGRGCSEAREQQRELVTLPAVSGFNTKEVATAPPTGEQEQVLFFFLRKDAHYLLNEKCKRVPLQVREQCLHPENLHGPVSKC